ncbi:DegT/DnrJ/EryC1/StrS family aminotransferase [Streptomyces sp. NPDC021100]|uniref:DegT/DnrJ/EryC1/StrS family aminotransferase n=1 Tax=Streptomyces sp. NPDC021100 TaxID=3365114 RepID=UPI0037B78755
MSVLVWAYGDEYEAERAEILDAVDTVFSSGRLVLGPSVRDFETEFAAYHGIAHCVGVDNGTNAVKLALQALGIGPGDEVITVSNTAAPTVVAIAGTGADVRFVDIDPATFLMDPAALAAAVTPRTRCVVPVHLYGQCAAMEEIGEVARAHGLAVVEDCAQAHGARRNGTSAGTFGDAAAYSFYPTKVLGAYGDGGAVLTGRADVDRALRRLRYYGMEERYFVETLPAHNSRLDEVQAEILRRKLRRLDDYIAARRAVADRYQEALKDTSLTLPHIAPGNDHVYYLYVARHPRRDLILERLRAHDIELNVSYRWPVHTMKGFAGTPAADAHLPVTEECAEEIFSLPMYPSLRRDVQERVIEALLKVLSTVD